MTVSDFGADLAYGVRHVVGCDRDGVRETRAAVIDGALVDVRRTPENGRQDRGTGRRAREGRKYAFATWPRLISSIGLSAVTSVRSGVITPRFEKRP